MIATALLVAVVLWIVSDTQRSALLRANDDDIATVLAGYRQEGIDEAKEVLRQRIGPSADEHPVGGRTYMRIQGRDTQHSFGNIPSVPETTGVIDESIDSIAITGRGVRLSDAYYLFVGRDTASLTITRDRILKSGLWVMIGSLVVSAGGGMLLATRLIRRVDDITRTCESIVAGRLGERIAATHMGSEWERLAVAINGMLDRISRLLESLQQVSSDIAHDLRTPLTRMRQRLEIARDTALTGSGHWGAIDRAIEDTDQILGLFSAVLRIAQIGAGTRAASFVSVNVAELLGIVYQLYQPVAEDSRRTLEYAAGPRTLVLGDPELLLQMMSNLVENAIRHTPEGSHIELRLRQNTERVRVEVADNGVGIPDRELGKVTGRFYRLERSRSSPGHGLGLALVEAVAHLHGASLILENRTPGLVAGIEMPCHC